MRKLIALGLLAGLALAALFVIPAGAKPPGLNGQIVFGRFDPALGDTLLYTMNPDGSHEHQVLPFTSECPHWSADGSRIVTCGLSDGTTSALIINPDTGDFRGVPVSDPTLSLACPVPSPDLRRLACGQFDQAVDPSRNGMYSIRSSDGGGLSRITSNPGGSDEPGDYSPSGRRLVFGRSDQNGDRVGLFVVNVNGTGLEQITPTGTLLTEGVDGNWSPQGNEIVFSRHVTGDVRSSLWVVHSDGSGLHEIQVRGVACGGANEDPNGVGCFAPGWSPDGTKIVFVIRSAEGTNLYTINADGSGLTQVTNDGDVEFVDWGTHPLAG